MGHHRAGARAVIPWTLIRPRSVAEKISLLDALRISLDSLIEKLRNL